MKENQEHVPDLIEAPEPIESPDVVMEPRESEKLLACLQNQIEAIRQADKPLEAEDFYQLGRSLESYRDSVRDYLDGLPSIEDRAAAEDRLYPAVHLLVKKIDALAAQAVEAGIILKNGQMQYDLGMLGVSLTFVTGFTKLVV